MADIARLRPTAVALIQGNRSRTYEELDATADAWAARLAEAGVTRESLVPILMPRGIELVTTILAVLKLGAAYALCDPTWPDRRLREVADQLGARLLLTDQDGMGRIGPALWFPPEDEVKTPDDFRAATVTDTDPACVFFTSGTTGRPKGVLSPHRATTRLFHPEGFLPFGPDTVIPLAAALPWDAFSLELWAALLNGGTSVIIDEPYLTAFSLRDVITRHGVQTVWLTSSLFNMIVDEDPEAFDGLHTVIIGGERLSTSHVRAFLHRHPGIRLVNGYGPVESTVFVATHDLLHADCDLPDGVPVGRPVPGTGIHVLEGQRLCAAGEIGEICVTGEGLALGYLERGELNSTAFPSLTLGGRTERVYRTGDLGYRDEQGVLHYCGRADRQLKVRGHRIEPAEIERQIEELLLSVRACRVVARRDAAGAAQGLLAFCVPATAGDPLTDASAVLRSALVPYQCPELVISIDAFPLTPTGKLDERRLLASAPHPGGRLPAPSSLPERPAKDGEDETTLLVREAFAGVLDTDDIPHDVPFAELGGTSLAAGRVCARLAARLGLPLPLSRFFRDPTVAGVATWLARERRTMDVTDAHSGLSPSDTTSQSAPADTLPDVPLTPMQTVHLTRHLLDPTDRTAYCMVFWTVTGPLDRAALAAAVAQVHSRHEPLRSAYVIDPQPTALVMDIEAPDLETLPARPSVEAAVETLRTELSDLLEITEGEIWRAAVVPVAAADTVVFGCVVHHIAFDGWSESILAGELAAAYNTVVGSGIHTAPPPLPLAKAWEQRTMRRERADLATQRALVTEDLAHVPELLWPLPGRASGPRTPRSAEVLLTPAETAAIDCRAADAGVTRFVALLAAYAQTLAEITGQRDFAVGVPVAQRADNGLDQVIGCHVETVCVRLRGAALTGGGTALPAVRLAVERAFTAQDLSLPEVLETVRPRRSARPPLFQTLFVLQDNAAADLRLDGLRTRFVRPPYLDLPLEAHTEVWPLPDGGARLVLSSRPDALDDRTAHELLKRFADRLRTGNRGHRDDPGSPHS
ncbi:non-ribosomal peptide synthetase [Streptomyces sp. WAC 05379]|uniref:non-ribosomal peptide synthetase n=1 Tax=Streptomyces sp. WAC 05379 TaxID=2203207 RepID=UPI000F736F26|nr:non-ribosomal peptide synthetase [Streptomyces sp. WAC 05379]RSO05756.1 non-ribosomal peptide synthetase [Streptomyces sp. WAC 05379]